MDNKLYWINTTYCMTPNKRYILPSNSKECEICQYKAYYYFLDPIGVHYLCEEHAREHASKNNMELE
jgi:hypothetical protein